MSLEREILNEVNELRRDPRNYANKVNKFKGYLEGNILRVPGVLAGIKTEEGAAAYDEAINFLRSAESAEQLTPSKGLGQIADELYGKIQHVDPNNLGDIDMDAIIDKYGSFTGKFSRSFEFGGSTAELIVVNLVVSDGDKSRGQRNALLNKEVLKVGIKHGKHDTYRECTVIACCSKFENKSGDDSAHL